MKISALLPSQKTRGTKKDAAGSCCSTRVEAKTWRMQGLGRRCELEARRHCGEGKGKKRTLGTHGKRAEVENRSSPKESEEALFRNILLWDDVISTMVKELREAGRSLVARYAGMEKDRCQRAEGDGCLLEVAPLGKLHSEAQSSKADIGPTGESRVGVNQKGSLERREA